jgi:hypothetical protein
MQHVKGLLDQAIETLAIQTNTVISANTAAASEWDFGFQTFGEAKLSEMLGAAKDFIRDMAIGKPPRWLSFLGRCGTGKTHLARSISRFFKAEASIYIEPKTGGAFSQARRIYRMAQSDRQSPRWRLQDHRRRVQRLVCCLG